MKTLIRVVFLLALGMALGFRNDALAAKNWTWYIDFINVVPGTPGYIDVVIGVKANTVVDTGRLGTCALRGTMSAGLYDFGTGYNPVRQTSHLGSSYEDSLTNPTGTNNWQYACVYIGTTGNGALVTQAGILVTTLRFYIYDATGTSSITLGTLQQTYEDNNITPVTVSYDNGNGNVPLPIQLASFTASVIRNNEVEISWRTISETNNYGFELQRKRGETGDWKKVGFVEGHGTTLQPQSYSYIDRSVTFGKYHYRIKQIDLDGKSDVFPEMEVSVGVGPDKFVLAQNYPNPFNSSTIIEFAVPQNGRAILKVYNVLGQEVATLFEGNAEAGKIYTAHFDASKRSSGVYFYRLQSGSFIETKKLVLMR